MKNVIKLLGIALAAVIGFGMVSCGDGGGDGDGDGGDPFDKLPTAERYSTSAYDDSTATIDTSVADDGVCTITVGGTAITALPAWDHIWKTNVQYRYTATAGKTYTYTFEAWTADADRTLIVQWYEDQDKETYHNTGYTSDGLPTFKITPERTTYTITGEELIPKSGKQILSFHCANQTGTFYVKIISISEVGPKKITITGITGKTGNAGIDVLSPSGDNWDSVAGGKGSISGNSVTFNLKTMNEDYSYGNPWEGGGPCYLSIYFDEDEFSYGYVYTNGQTLAQLGITIDDPFYHFSKVPKYTISSTTSTIAFNKFIRVFMK